MGKRSGLVREFERILEANELCARIQRAPIHDLRAVEKLLRRRVGRKGPGALAKYPDELIASVRREVRHEIARQRSDGARGVGPKRAIKKLVERAVIKREGQPGLYHKRERIPVVVGNIFKIWEAGRKRG